MFENIKQNIWPNSTQSGYVYCMDHGNIFLWPPLPNSHGALYRLLMSRLDRRTKSPSMTISSTTVECVWINIRSCACAYQMFFVYIFEMTLLSQNSVVSAVPLHKFLPVKSKMSSMQYFYGVKPPLSTTWKGPSVDVFQAAN